MSINAAPPVRMAESSRRARTERGLPDRRDREPLAVLGETWWPSMGHVPGDLLELAQLDDALDAAARELDDLAVGVAIPGAPGACTDCHHYRPWHRAGRRDCELCDCRKWARS